MSEPVRFIAEDFAERVWNQKDLTAIGEYMDESTIIHTHLKDYHGKQRMEDVASAWTVAFPDLRIENENIISENDLVSIQWHAHGTHLGVYREMNPTGNPVTCHGVTVYRIRNGKIIEYWSYRSGPILI